MALLKPITASVRTTTRINALLSESMMNRRKALTKLPDADEGGTETEQPKNDFKYFHLNFNMERVCKIIEATIEDRLIWDRLNRTYDSWRALHLAENLAADIRDRVKKLKFIRHRIVCFLSIIEKHNQGFTLKMRHLMDEKRDNFTNFIYERPSYFIVATLFLVHKD